MKRLSTVLALLSAGFALWAAEVHVYECTSAGGAVVTTRVETVETGVDYVSSVAPSKNSYIFTEWQIGVDQALNNRDPLGRARNRVKLRIYEDTTLTAQYVASSLDSDGDGIADGTEIYWYGNLDQGAESDSDGDGFTLSQELATGRNPRLADGFHCGDVAVGGGPLLQYNPHSWQPYTLRSDPEGKLFATKKEYVAPGTVLKADAQSTASGFAYWTANGVRQVDAAGRAKSVITVTMPDGPLELVAVTVSGDSDGDGVDDNLEYHWYGNLDQDGASDTDGDGFTLAQELATGRNPLFADGFQCGDVANGAGALLQYNPHSWQPYTLRSDPDGKLFATKKEYVAPGTVLKADAQSTASGFAYWTANGVRQVDAAGRAKSVITVTMPDDPLELVAVTVSGDSDGDGVDDNLEYHWYLKSA